MKAVDDVLIADTVAQVWESSRDVMLHRVDVLEDAALAVLEGQLSVRRRTDAEQEAHRLAGSLGSFGLVNGSRLAREAAWLLRGERTLEPGDALRLSELVVGLRADVVSPPPAAGGESVPGEREEADSVLVLEPDEVVLHGLVEEAVALGLRVTAVRSPDAARASLLDARPDLVVLDPADPDFLYELCDTDDPVPTLVLAGPDTKVDRATAVRLGCLGFVEKPVRPTKVMSVVRELLGRRNRRSTVLAATGDPMSLAALYNLAERRGIRVEELQEPARFWHQLELIRPELVVLDEDLPQLDSVQLCQMVRADPGWQRLPVIVLTRRTGAGTRDLYEAGVDDVVPKEAAADELAVRVDNRLARSRQSRPVGEAGTGLMSALRFEWDVRRLLGLARRYGQPVAVGVFTVDEWDTLTRHGRTAAPAALAALGRLLQRSFRFEDVVGFLDDRHLVTAMYGADPAGTRERVATLLEAFRHEQVPVDEIVVESTASAGMAMFPLDGANVHSLTAAAMAALHRSTAEGGDRVTMVSDEQPSRAGNVDVLVVDDDDAIASLLVHALETRGYRTQWLNDGAEAAAALLGPDGLHARVILLDVGLPGLDGLSVLRELSRRQVLARTRVIMVTMRSSEREVLQALELGAFDHVAKPLSVPLLLHRVRQALQTLPA